ncbi:MAG: asparagine--tRNA ligase [Alphaproteobacteria bacterium]|nr:asparagine--tRNA ligase [Alphaproteobacteria bacterium]
MTRGVGRRVPIAKLLETASVGNAVEVTGWIRTSRFSKNVSFVALYDGSSADTVQIVLGDETDEELKKRLGVGASLRVKGEWVASPGAGQAFEIRAQSIEVVGDCDASSYPLQKKSTSLEYLRTIAHLRPRSKTHQSVVRVRNALSWHIHKYFQDRGFHWIHTPIITASDAEGAGELFEVTAGDKEEGFFGKRTFLTVSGQLEVECFAQSHTDVYTFGPTFRAENSNTPRHAAEFWMIEPEMAFADLDDVIALAEDFVRTVARNVMDQLPGDFAFFEFVRTKLEKGPSLLEQLESAISQPFARVTYAEAQEILAKVDRKWEFPVGYGTSMQAEHERYLAEEHFQRPVFVTNYPRDQKAFYMRLDDGEQTVSATDLLVPRVGEMIGGSQREERFDKLVEQMEFHHTPPDDLWWYLELRQFGTTPHGGFGLGLERMLMWMTGIHNIRDSIPFPRTPGSAEF